MRTVYVRYKNPFARTDAEDVGMYLTELLRKNPNCRFYLIIAPNRMFAVGKVKEEKSEQWRLRDLHHIRDDQYRPYFLYFSPSELPQCEYQAIMYGGIKGKVEREKSAPLHFYLLEADLRLNDEQRQAGATKEAVWEIFAVESKDGNATIRPLLSDHNAMLVVSAFNMSAFELSTVLTTFANSVMM
jgi:hypothetical protein